MSVANNNNTSMVRTCGPNATFRKYVALNHAVSTLGVKEMRNIFHQMRTFEHVNQDTFMPQYGMTTGEFSCFKTLSEQSRRDARS